MLIKFKYLLKKINYLYIKLNNLNILKKINLVKFIKSTK